ncbi:MAG: lipoprotein [Clostridia bacterium]|nr:lipoprotein [Clostridia bacterium]
MKKIGIFLLITLLLILAGCNGGIGKTATATTTTAAEQQQLIDWDTVSDDVFRELYWAAKPITADTEKYDFTIGDYTCWLSKNESRLYNPRLLEDGSIIYIDERGYLAVDGQFAAPNHYISPNKGQGEMILSSPTVAVFWDTSNNSVIEMSENKVTRSQVVPEGATYCGYSRWAGFIFKLGDEVYAVFQDRAEEELKKIADGVKTVIATDFRLTSDAWSNPLFLMEDGSLKGYITWEEGLYEFTGTIGSLYYPYLDRR